MQTAILNLTTTVRRAECEVRGWRAHDHRVTRAGRVMRAVVVMLTLALNLSGADLPADLEARSFTTTAGLVLPYRLLRPSTPVTTPVPLVIFLHGAGGRGNDNRTQVRDGLLTLLPEARTRGVFLIAPQCPLDQKWTGVNWQQKPHTPRTTEPTTAAAAVLALITALATELPIDEKRILLTGVSMGGSGTWDLASRAPQRFAAILPICGGCDAASAALLSGVPLWAFHGAKDDVVSVELPRAMIAALRAAGASPQYREYPDGGHNIGPRVYADHQALEWLFTQRR